MEKRRSDQVDFRTTVLWIILLGANVYFGTGMAIELDEEAPVPAVAPENEKVVLEDDIEISTTDTAASFSTFELKESSFVGTEEPTSNVETFEFGTIEQDDPGEPNFLMAKLTDVENQHENITDNENTTEAEPDSTNQEPLEATIDLTVEEMAPINAELQSANLELPVNAGDFNTSEQENPESEMEATREEVPEAEVLNSSDEESPKFEQIVLEETVGSVVQVVDPTDDEQTQITPNRADMEHSTVASDEISTIEPHLIETEKENTKEEDFETIKEDKASPAEPLVAPSEAEGASGISSISDAADEGESDKIINGELAEEGTFTSVVSLQHVNNSQPFCGGTILNRDFVLTAAHCIFSKDGDSLIDFKIVSSNIDLKRETRTYWPITIIVHAQYNKSIFLGYDIALIRVEPKFILGDGESNVFLPPQNEITPVGTEATVVGWGRTDQRYLSDKVLRVLEESVIDNEECAERLNYKPSIYDFHLCAQPKPQTGFCRGDSGGPVFVKNKQVGVVSWYKGNCSNEEPLPNVFTRVAHFTNWIHEKIDEEEKFFRKR